MFVKFSTGLRLNNTEPYYWLSGKDFVNEYMVVEQQGRQTDKLLPESDHDIRQERFAQSASRRTHQAFAVLGLELKVIFRDNHQLQ